MSKKRTNNKRELIRIAEYMVSGGAYFWSGYAMFFFADRVFGWNLWWAKLASNLFGWTINYLLQRYWVFNNPKLNTNKTAVTGRYLVITAVDFVLDYFIIKGLKSIGITPYIGAFISSGLFTVWNYLWYRFWVFPDKFKAKAIVTPPRIIAHRAHGPSAYQRVR